MKEAVNFNSKKEWENYLWLKFLEDIKKSSGEKTAKFLDNLLTPDEKKKIIKRVVALALIKEGKSYKEIGRILWISPATISALKKSILDKSPGYKGGRYHYKKSKEEKSKKIKEIPPVTVFDYWLNIPLPTMTGKGRWRFLYYQGPSTSTRRSRR